jgi:hypothetical protein
VKKTLNTLCSVDMNTQQQYAKEMQERYFKYLQKENEQERVLLEKEKRRQRKQERQETKRQPRESIPPPSVAYRVHNVIIDSDFRDTTLYPNANDFVVKTQDTLKNIYAIRLLKTEFYQPSNSFGYFVLNEAKVPLQLYNVAHAYLYLNGWINTTAANEENIPFFGRIGPGMEMYPPVASSDPLSDPFMYVCRPPEGKMRRYHVKLLNSNGTAYPVTNARVVLTIAVYSVGM